MRPAASWSDLDPAAAVAALLEARAAGVEKRAAIDGSAFLDQLKDYGSRGLAAARDYGGRGAAALQEGLTSGDDRTRLLYGGLAGAGLGALGGGLAGATGPRKKSPWTTALSGALAGGALGGGLAYGLPALQRGMTEPARPPGTGAEAAAEHLKAPLPARLTAIATGASTAGDDTMLNTIGIAAGNKPRPRASAAASENPIDYLDPATRHGAEGVGALAGGEAGRAYNGLLRSRAQAAAFRTGADNLPKSAPNTLTPGEIAAVQQVRRDTTGLGARATNKAVARAVANAGFDRKVLALPPGQGAPWYQPWNWAAGRANTSLKPMRSAPTTAYSTIPSIRAAQATAAAEQASGLKLTRSIGMDALRANGKIPGPWAGAARVGIGALLGSQLPNIGSWAHQVTNPYIPSVPE